MNQLALTDATLKHYSVGIRKAPVRQGALELG